MEPTVCFISKAFYGNDVVANFIFFPTDFAETFHAKDNALWLCEGCHVNIVYSLPGCKFHDLKRKLCKFSGED